MIEVNSFSIIEKASDKQKFDDVNLYLKSILIKDNNNKLNIVSHPILTICYSQKKDSFVMRGRTANTDPDIYYTHKIDLYDYLDQNKTIDDLNDILDGIYSDYVSFLTKCDHLLTEALYDLENTNLIELFCADQVYVDNSIKLKFYSKLIKDSCEDLIIRKMYNDVDNIELSRNEYTKRALILINNRLLSSDIKPVELINNVGFNVDNIIEFLGSSIVTFFTPKDVFESSMSLKLSNDNNLNKYISLAYFKSEDADQFFSLIENIHLFKSIRFKDPEINFEFISYLNKRS